MSSKDLIHGGEVPGRPRKSSSFKRDEIKAHRGDTSEVPEEEPKSGERHGESRDRGFQFHANPDTRPSYFSTEIGTPARTEFRYRSSANAIASEVRGDSPLPEAQHVDEDLFSDAVPTELRVPVTDASSQVNFPCCHSTADLSSENSLVTDKTYILSSDASKTILTCRKDTFVTDKTDITDIVSSDASKTIDTCRKDSVVTDEIESSTSDASNTTVVARSKSSAAKALRFDEVMRSTNREETVLPFHQLIDHAQLASEHKPDELLSEPQNEDNTIRSTEPIKFSCQRSIPTCLSAKLFEDYYVLIFPDRVEKQDRNTKETLSRLSIKDAFRLCSVGKNSNNVAVLQMPASKLTIVSATEALQIKYVINLHSNYSNVCHVDTYKTNSNKLPEYLYVFCAARCGTHHYEDDKVALIKAAPSHSSQRHLKLQQYSDVTRVLKVPGVKGITGMATLEWNMVVVSCSVGVICFRYESNTDLAKIIWTVPNKRTVTDVCCTVFGDSKRVLASVQDANCIMHLDRNGVTVEDNILPKGSSIRPDRISARGNEILVKQFNELTWSSFVKEVE